MKQHWLGIWKCPHGILSVCLDTENGGTRLTSDKCCGRWNLVKQWPLSAEKMNDMVIELERAIEDAERETA